MVRETLATMLATMLAELDSDGDGMFDAMDTDDNDNNIVDTDAAETGVGFPGGVFTDLNTNGIHDATETGSRNRSGESKTGYRSEYRSGSRPEHRGSGHR